MFVPLRYFYHFLGKILLYILYVSDICLFKFLPYSLKLSRKLEILKKFGWLSMTHVHKESET